MAEIAAHKFQRPSVNISIALRTITPVDHHTGLLHRLRNHFGILGVVTVLVTAAWVRLYALTLKPLHHDEGVNGLFLLKLFREGIYRYDAANYHGPTLYYCALITSSINNLLFGGEGTSTFAIRIVPVLFGVGIVYLTSGLRSRLGNVGAMFAAGLLALSSGMVYFSRDFIHEIPLVFFTLWLVVCLTRFYDTQQPKELLLASIALALMFATKETAVISLTSIIASAGLAKIFIRQPNLTLAQLGGRRRLILLLVGCCGLFLASTILFFSSFFSNYAQGMHEAVATYSYWFRTGMTQHKAPWYTYLDWLLREEAVIFFSSTCGTVLALFQRRNRFALFSGLWSFTLLFAYSVLPYKTPWILVNVLVPMALSAGHAAQQLWNATLPVPGKMVRRAVVGLIAGTLLFTLYQSVQLNLYHYDDGQYVYPYVQTRREFLDLVQQVNQAADLNGTGNDTSVAIMAPEYWPLPWYLRDYKNTGYFGKAMQTNAAIVIASVRQLPELVPLLADRYRLIGTYPLRPGVQLVVYVAYGRIK